MDLILVATLAFFLMKNFRDKLILCLHFTILIIVYFIASPYPLGLMTANYRYPYIAPTVMIFYLALIFSVLVAIEAIRSKSNFFLEINPHFLMYCYYASFILLNAFYVLLDEKILNTALITLFVVISSIFSLTDLKAGILKSRFTLAFLWLAVTSISTLAMLWTVSFEINFDINTVVAGVVATFSFLLYKRHYLCRLKKMNEITIGNIVNRINFILIFISVFYMTRYLYEGLV
jgi:hypothetical protein